MHPNQLSVQSCFTPANPPKPSVACANAGDVSSCLSVPSGELLIQVQLRNVRHRVFSPRVNVSAHYRTVLACSRRHFNTERDFSPQPTFSAHYRTVLACSRRHFNAERDFSPQLTFSAHSRTVLVCKVCGCSVDNTTTLTIIAASEFLC